MDEQPLTGGRHVGAVRIGETVHRPANPWTPSVHAVLAHLEEVGFEGAPRVLGFDEQGRAVGARAGHRAQRCLALQRGVAGR
ncbi:hypothetical protein [Nonomuraea sp. NPDC050202]|uniref:hypothetical protein n=1 Tax=Nonomuraea sp. NPDC050202 TaxID=3155035 RepID=UPI0033F8DE6D